MEMLTMAEYIDRGALLPRLDCYGTNKFGMLDEDIRAFVKGQPAVDVAPVVHGHWVKHIVARGWTVRPNERYAKVLQRLRVLAANVTKQRRAMRQLLLPSPAGHGQAVRQRWR